MSSRTVVVERREWPQRLLRGAASLLVLYGSLGLCFNLRLPQRIAEGIGLWGHLLREAEWVPLESLDPWVVPQWLQQLQVHFDRIVLLLWCFWGVGVLLLGLAAGQRCAPSSAAGRSSRRSFSWRDGGALVLLAAILWAGYQLRARFLLPLSNGVFPLSHYDEMVYLEASLLWQRGLQPYVDFFLAHPPGVLYALWPATLPAAGWGGAALLQAGRWWQCFYGLGSVVLMYVVGRRVGGRRGGLLAALVLALDVQAAQVAPLETVVNLATLLALALYVAATEVSGRWLRIVLTVLAGGMGAVAALTKAPGAVTLLLLALLALLAGRWRDLLAGAGGVAAAGLLLAGPFALRAPGSFWRSVVAFQLLRPQETLYGRNHLIRMADSPEARLTFLVLAGALLYLSGRFTLAAWRRPRRGGAHSGPPAEERTARWAAALSLSVVPLLALFSYGRAYHSRYSIQLLVPFALLGAAALGRIAGRRSRMERWQQVLALTAVGCWALLLWPHLAQQRMAAEEVRYDGTYGVIGQALQERIPADAAVLALDPGYPLMADRPPTSLPDGTLLVDAAGQMVYRSLGIAEMSLGRVVAAARQASREIEPGVVFHQPEAQDLILSGLWGAAASVIDPRIAAEDLTPQTQEFLSTRGETIAWEQYTAAFTVDRVEPLGRNQSGLILWDMNMRVLSEQGEGPAALPGEALEAAPGSVLQVSLYWIVGGRPATPLGVGLELRDQNDWPVAALREPEPPHFGSPPTDRWAPGWVYQDHHNMQLPDLSGEYTLYLTLWEMASEQPQPWQEGGQGSLPIGVVRLQR